MKLHEIATKMEQGGLQGWVIEKLIKANEWASKNRTSE